MRRGVTVGGVRLGGIAIGGLALALLGGCATDDPGDDPTTTATETSTATAPPDADGNGAIYVTAQDGERKVITRYAIGAEGELGAPTQLLDEEADGEVFPAVVDGLGDMALTGSIEQYWTTAVQVRDAATGAVTTEVAGDRWCGGEGLTYNVCVLVDEGKLARTSELGGEGLNDGTIELTSLADGSTIGTFGPYPGLRTVLGTEDPNTLFIVIDSAAQTDPPEPQPGSVQRLDLTTGQATELGTFEAGWQPLCALGTEGVFGYPPDGSGPPSVVGAGTIGEVTWDEEESPHGCSADGRFLYLQDIPQPPDEETEDTEAANPPTTIQRITLADGARASGATLDPGVWIEHVTR